MAKPLTYMLHYASRDGRKKVLRYRPNTADAFIVDQVFRQNEYQLPDDMTGWVVVDIGAHIGAFSMRCAAAGAKRVEAFEMFPGNAEILHWNVKQWPEVVFYEQMAMWRSDIEYPCTLKTHGPNTATTGNTGDGNTMFQNGDLPMIEVEACGLDIYLGSMSVDLLKLDCESAEWPILLTSRRLSQCKRIVGEYHEINGEYDENQVSPHACVNGATSYTISQLTTYLQDLGFTVMSKRFLTQEGKPSNMGLFWAVQKDCVGQQ